MAKVGALSLLVAAVAVAGKPPPPALAGDYRETAARILDAALKDDGAERKLEFLTDHIGHRLSGSPALEQAVDWSVRVLTGDGHDNVHTEKVMVPHWERGEESGRLIAPVKTPLHLLALGASAATRKGGVTAPVVMVRDLPQLEARGASEVAGKIVLFNCVMPPYGTGVTKYDDTVKCRNNGPSLAAKLGAVAALVRSVTARSMNSPHTGMTEWEKGVAPIPAAAVSLEDAELMARLSAAGEPVAVQLELGGRTLPDATSANVVAELRGRERPDEVVLLAAHLDSWDVGQGAHDDGAGCATVMEAITVLRRLGLTPRRTIRVVLFTNEENGVAGAKAYAAAHRGELALHVAAIEADSGAFQPQGFSVETSDARRATVLAKVTEIAALLAPVGATRALAGSGGADISELTGTGPLLGLEVDESTYFDYHHSDADTFDKIDPRLLAKNVAAVAVMAYVLADMPERL